MHRLVLFEQFGWLQTNELRRNVVAATFKKMLAYVVAILTTPRALNALRTFVFRSNFFNLIHAYLRRYLSNVV